LIWRRKPILTSFAKNQKNQSVFDTKFDFGNLANKKPWNPSDFPSLSNDFQPIFYLKIKFWIKNDKLVDFSSLSLDFSGSFLSSLLFPILSLIHSTVFPLGITLSIWLQKPVLTVLLKTRKTGLFLIQNSIFESWGKTPKTEQFSGLSVGFPGLLNGLQSKAASQRLF
jgi:hypothetical protein